MDGKRLVICDDVLAAELRKLARREPDRAAAAREAFAKGGCKAHSMRSAPPIPASV